MKKLSSFVLAFLAVSQAAGISSGQEKVIETASSTVSSSTKIVSTAVAKTKATPKLDATHKQTGIFTPKIGDKPALLTTFKMNTSGEIVACVSSQPGKNQKGYVQVYDSNFKLKKQYELPFLPTALDLDNTNQMFVAGDGKLLKLNADGKTLKMAGSPNMKGVDMEELKKEIAEEMKEQQKEIKKIYGEQIDIFKKEIKKIEDIKEEDRSDVDKLKLKNFKQQLSVYEQILKQQTSQEFKLDDQQLEFRLKAATRITALAVTQKDLFVSTSARTGSGYEVYRMTLDMEKPKRVLKKLRGCCGQMDIHAMGDNIYVAENTKFQVGVYSREGKPVLDFGKRFSKTNEQGFGSCCNPMNVMCCSNGDIITAESSIGKLKRFNSKGELVGYVGRARIGGGCKHVSFGHDTARDRYFVQYEDKNYICVLTKYDPSKSAATNPKVVAMTEKLTAGKWVLAKSKEKPKNKKQLGGAGFQGYDYLTNMKSIDFKADFSCETVMAQSQFSLGNEGGMKWVPIEVKENTLYLDIETEDNVITYRVKVKFEKENQAQISVSYDGIGEEGKFKTFQKTTRPMKDKK